MSEWRKFSRLPESPEYWRGLQDRVDRAARPFLPRRGMRRDRWLDGALVTAVLSAAAVIGLIILRPARPAIAPTFQASLAPADPVAVELLNSERPPHISGLLPAFATRQRQ
jgi:hypothetical protein